MQQILIFMALDTNIKKIVSVYLIIPALFKFFKILFSSSKRKVIVSLVQHLGDNIASEPIHRVLRKQNSNEFIIRIIGVQYAEVLKYDSNINLIISVSCLSEWIYLKFLLKKFVVYDLHVNGSFCQKYRLNLHNPNAYNINSNNYLNHGCLLEIFAKCSGLNVNDVKPVYWLPENEKELNIIAEKYVVIHVISNSTLKDWNIEKWNNLIDILYTQYQLHVIEIGLQSLLNNNRPYYHNYCGKLSFPQIAQLIKESGLFIGIDSAFAHFANCFDIPKLILFGDLYGVKHFNPYSGMSDEQKQNQLFYSSTGNVKDIQVNDVVVKLATLI